MIKVRFYQETTMEISEDIPRDFDFYEAVNNGDIKLEVTKITVLTEDGDELDMNNVDINEITQELMSKLSDKAGAK